LHKADIGIIGGSGLYSMPGFTAQEEVSIVTPWGAPSDNFVVGKLGGKTVAFLARHGRGHRISPSELNFRANIYGMKSLGVDRIISLSAVGSLKEDHRPLDFVIPDQFFDRTRGRISTFFGEGLVAHVSFADPVCPQLSSTVSKAAREAGVTAKQGGTYLCMEGPAFSTKAESNVYRSWGMDVIGMTNLQEAKLAREAEICYVTVAMVTDYDCWHPHHHGDRYHRQPQPECRKRLQGGGRCGDGDARRPHLQMRLRVGARYHYRPEAGARIHPQETGLNHWQVLRVARWPNSCSPFA
jgi:5'-methylthioadenosine phosphorylase